MKKVQQNIKSNSQNNEKNTEKQAKNMLLTILKYFPIFFTIIMPIYEFMKKSSKYNILGIPTSYIEINSSDIIRSVIVYALLYFSFSYAFSDKFKKIVSRQIKIASVLFQPLYLFLHGTCVYTIYQTLPKFHNVIFDKFITYIDLFPSFSLILFFFIFPLITLNKDSISHKIDNTKSAIFKSSYSIIAAISIILNVLIFVLYFILSITAYTYIPLELEKVNILDENNNIKEYIVSTEYKSSFIIQEIIEVKDDIYYISKGKYRFISINNVKIENNLVEIKSK